MRSNTLLVGSVFMSLLLFPDNIEIVGSASAETAASGDCSTRYRYYSVSTTPRVVSSAGRPGARGTIDYDTMFTLDGSSSRCARLTYSVQAKTNRPGVILEVEFYSHVKTSPIYPPKVTLTTGNQYQARTATWIVRLPDDDHDVKVGVRIYARNIDGGADSTVEVLDRVLTLEF